MKKIFYFFLLLLIFDGIIVRADNTCTKEELERLKELASKVQISYDYEFKEVKQDGDVLKYPLFSLTADNLNSDIKVMSIKNDVSTEFKNGEKTSATLKNIGEGKKINILIKAYVPNRCSGRTLESRTIKIPYYNRYSEKEVCKVYPEFQYCSQFADDIITLEKFNNELMTYIDSLTTSNKQDKTPESNWMLLFLIGGGIVILTIIVIITMIIAKKRRKNSL